MKRVFTPALLGTWFTGRLPAALPLFRKKSPWYRRAWMDDSPWIFALLLAPLAVLAGWRAVVLLRPRGKRTD